MSQAAPSILTAPDRQHLLLDEVPWSFYEQLLERIGDRPLRVTYYKGRLEVMSPLPQHDKWKWRIGRMVGLITLELDIPMTPLGSTTFRRKDRDVGLEPDDCFYIRNAAFAHGRDRFQIPPDPAPDLAVEVDITRRSIPRQPVYADLGVPELWRFDGTRLTVLELSPSGVYEERASSLAFPFLPMDEFRRFLETTRTTDDTTAMRAFQQWVRTLAKG